MARLAAAQAVHGTASVVLTGGGIGTAVLERVAELAAEPEHAVVDWTAVDVWWGDERFVPADDEERNELRCPPRAARPGGRAGRAGARHAALGRGFAEPRGRRRLVRRASWPRAAGGSGLPRFDVLLLGMGPEGHVASIFPDSPAVRDERPVVAVRDCPKPPPTRVSLGFSAINSAEEIWLLVSGEGKADAVAQALSGARAAARAPAGRACTAARATRWLLGRGRGAAPPQALDPPPDQPGGCRGASRLSASSRRASPSASLRRSRT